MTSRNPFYLLIRFVFIRDSTNGEAKQGTGKEIENLKLMKEKHGRNVADVRTTIL